MEHQIKTGDSPKVSAVSPNGSELLNANDSPNVAITRTITLSSGDDTPLFDEDCIKITLINNGNAALYKIGNSDSQATSLALKETEIYIDRANKILVDGTGTLSYIVHKRRVITNNLSPSECVVLKFSTNIHTALAANNIMDAFSVKVWNNIFSTDASSVAPFDAVSVDEANNLVMLHGASHIHLAEGILTGLDSLTRLLDNSGIIKSVAANALKDCITLSNVVLAGCISIGNNSFENDDALIEINLPVCTVVGTTAGDNDVFAGIAGNIIRLTIKLSASTDADIVALQGTNTVTLVTT